jgi:hypothetical protein
MTYITIPFSVELADEHSWKDLDDKKTSFGIVRFHFRLEDQTLAEPHAVGDAIGVYQKPRGMTMKHVKSDTTSIEQVISTKSIENHLLQSEVLAEVASELLAKHSITSLLGFKFNMKSKVSEKLSSSYTLGTEISSSEKVTRTETLTVENMFPPEIDETIVSVPVYKRRVVDVSLAYIDYLKVDYVRSPWGLRKKAKRHPKVVDHHNHPNRLPFGTPIATAYYWQLLPNSSKFIFERDHKVDVLNPLQITICEARSRKERVFNYRKDIPTLYKIARAAFPTKWILRKSVKQDWTEDQLNALEHDEVKGSPIWSRLFGNR